MLSVRCQVGVVSVFLMSFGVSCSQVQDGKAQRSTVFTAGDTGELARIEEVRNEEGEVLSLPGFTRHEALEDGKRDADHETIIAHSEEPLFEFEEPETVSATFSEPVMVTGSFLVNKRQALDCKALSYTDRLPKFRDLPRIQGSVIFCISLTSGDQSKYVVTPDFRVSIDQAIRAVSLSVSGPSGQAHAGFKRWYSAVAVFSDGKKQNVSSLASWEVSDQEIADIANGFADRGTLNPKKAGEVTVRAKALGISSDASGGSMKVTVNAETLSSVAVSVESSQVAPGFTLGLSATGIFSDQTTEDLTGVVTWKLSDPNLAEIVQERNSFQKWFIKATEKGTLTISASYGDLSSDESGQSPFILISDASLKALEVSSPSNLIALGFKEQFLATGIFSDKSRLDLSRAVTWKVSDPEKAGISNYKETAGLLTPLAEGKVRVYAEVAGISSESSGGSKEVQVSGASLTALKITGEKTTLASGFTGQFQALGTFSDGSVQNLTSSVAWSTDKGEVATVDNGSSKPGLVSAVGPGSTRLTAVLNQVVSNSLTVSVTSAILQNIIISSAIQGPLALGLTRQFSASGTFSDGSSQSLTNQVTWISTDTSVATISNAGQNRGLLTTYLTGNTDIKATFSSGNLTITSFTPKSLTVTSALLSSLRVTSPSSSVAKGFSEQFTATGTFSDGSEVDLSPLVTWSSTQPEVATISNLPSDAGVLYPQNTGSTVIDASLNGVSASDSSQTKTFNITAAVLVSVMVSQSAGDIGVGQTELLTATGVYSDESESDLTAQSVWSSSNLAVATVSLGTVSGKSPGTAEINATFAGISSADSANQASVNIVPSLSLLNLENTRRVTLPQNSIPFKDHGGSETYAFWIRARSQGTSGYIFDRGAPESGRLSLNPNGTFTYQYWTLSVTTPDTGACSVSGTEWVHVSVRRWWAACSGQLEILVNGVTCGSTCSVGWYLNPVQNIDVGDANIDILDFRYDDTKKTVSSINNDRFTTSGSGWYKYWNFSTSDTEYGLDGNTSGGGALYRETSSSSDPRNL